MRNHRNSYFLYFLYYSKDHVIPLSIFISIQENKASCQPSRWTSGCGGYDTTMSGLVWAAPAISHTQLKAPDTYAKILHTYENVLHTYIKVLYTQLKAPDGYANILHTYIKVLHTQPKAPDTYTKVLYAQLKAPRLEARGRVYVFLKHQYRAFVSSLAPLFLSNNKSVPLSVNANAGK